MQPTETLRAGYTAALAPDSRKWNQAMRPVAALIAVLVGLGLAACGSSSKTSAGTATAASHTGHHSDRDNDGDHNDDDGNVLGFGQAANAAQLRSIAALVTSYFDAAAAADGAKACALLVPLQAESVVEQDGRSPSLRGDSCAVVMSKLFELHHQLLLGKASAMKIIAVRIQGDVGLVVVEFPEIYEARQIGVRRTGDSWKVFDLLDGIIE